MIAEWLRRAARTRAGAADRSGVAMQRRLAADTALRALGAAQMLTQLLLWITLYAYDRVAQTAWQAALLSALPLAGLWAVWHGGGRALSTRAGARWALLLLPCLMLDAAVALRALAGYIAELIPEYPLWACTAAPAALCWLTALLSRRNGAAYGTKIFWPLLAALFLLSTVFLRTTAHPVRLWPLLGQGVGRTAAEALSGAGSAWGAALLFALPAGPAHGGERRASRSCALWAVLPWLMCVVWALWHGMVRPWRTDDVLAVGEQLMGLARHSRSTVLYECCGLMWMLLLPLGLTGCAVSGEKLLCRALPRVSRPLAALAVLLPGAAAALLWPDKLLDALSWALPWRAALSAAAGAAACALAARGGKEARAA